MKYEIIEDPPYETRGSVRPTTGNIPITIDMLIIDTKKNWKQYHTNDYFKLFEEKLLVIL